MNIETLAYLLEGSPAPRPMGSLDEWFDRHQALGARFPRPVDHALAASFGVDRLGYAFASAFQAGMRQLVDGLVADRIVALCATEGRSAHPASIATRLSAAPGAGRKLSGTKSLVTLGTRARTLLVVASEGCRADGRNLLRVAVVDAEQPGIRVEPLPALPFIPEVPHAAIQLDDVPVAEQDLLEGDGYTHYLKPFRTVEDCFVQLGLLGYLLQVAQRYGWPEAARQELACLACAVATLAESDPRAAAVHVALAGCLTHSASLLERLAPLWARVDPTVRERWERDRPLLSIAAAAREKRLAAAWQRLREPSRSA